MLLLSCLHRSQGLNICERDFKFDETDPTSITKNTVPKGPFRHHLRNASDIFQCMQYCCDNPNCNMAFFQLNVNCYLMACNSNEACEPVSNVKKLPNEIEDFLIKVRSFEESQKAAVKKPQYDCDPNSAHSCNENEACQLNESSNAYECQCTMPNFRKINKVCREYLSNRPPCERYINECFDKNEECLTLLSDNTKQGTCQCKLGFTYNNGGCMPVHGQPIPEVQQAKFIDLNSNEMPSTTPSTIAANKTESTTPESTTKKTIKISLSDLIEAEKNTALKEKKPIDDEVNLMSSLVAQQRQINAVAVAGPMQHIYYPENTCVLNGSNSKVMDSDDKIVRYKWLKSELSPAVGDFMQLKGNSSSDSPVAYITKLIEGEYTFILRVWTVKSGEQFLQDTVQVFVHREAPSGDYQFNLLRLNLNTNPRHFTELEKLNLVNKLEVILHQPSIINHPKVRLVNVGVDARARKSGVAVDFYVEDMGRLVDSDDVLRILRRSLLAGSQPRAAYFLKLNTHDLMQLRCANNCSNHGYCDQVTYECVCEELWMPNLYKYLFLVDTDITNGNNCEWNAVYVAVIGFGVFLAVFFVFYVVLICCCCCPRLQCSSDVDQINESCCRKLFRCIFCCCLCFCSRKKTAKSDRGKQSLIKGFRKRKETKYSLLEDLDESTSNKKLGKKSKQEHTYGMHSSDEDYRKKSLLKDDESDEEDILYEKNKYSSTVKKQKSDLNNNCA